MSVGCGCEGASRGFKVGPDEFATKLSFPRMLGWQVPVFSNGMGEIFEVSRSGF